MTWFTRTSILALILSLTLDAQDTTPASTVVNEMRARLLGPGPHFISSFDEKAAQRSGDSIAVAIARTQPRAALRDPAQARLVLMLIGMSFENPTMIAAEEDKNPGVSLLLLDAIVREAPDVTVQQGAKELITKLEGLVQTQNAIQ